MEIGSAAELTSKQAPLLEKILTNFYSQPTKTLSYSMPFPVTWNWYGEVSEDHMFMIKAWNTLSNDQVTGLLSSIPEDIFAANKLVYAVGNYVDFFAYNAQSLEDDDITIHATFVDHDDRSEMRRIANKLGLASFDLAFFSPFRNETNNITTIY